MPESSVRDFKNLLVVMTDRHIGNLLVSLYTIKAVHQKLRSDQTMVCVIDDSFLSMARYLLPEVEFLPFALRGKKSPLFKKLTLLIALVYQHLEDVAADLKAQRGRIAGLDNTGESAHLTAGDLGYGESSDRPYLLGHRWRIFATRRQGNGQSKAQKNSVGT